MNDLQKKLDELLALRVELIKLTNSDFNLTNFQNVTTPEFNSRVYGIIKNYSDQIKKNTNNFNDTNNNCRQLLIESQELANKSRLLTTNNQHTVRQSQHLATQSKQLAIESQRLANKSRLLNNNSQLLIRKSRQLINEIKKSESRRQQLIKKSKQVTATNNKDFKNKNTEIINYSINSLKKVITNIDIDIKNTTAQLIELTNLNKIDNLSNSVDYQQQFIRTFVVPNINPFIDDTLQLTLLNIRSLCNWHYPGLQLNPNSKEWIDCMVAADPLYLIGNNINTLIDNYPIEYQRRLRLYDIKNQDFSVLPQEQFGCIACCNFLNSNDLPIIENYLLTFFKLLRPGGNLICNLNFVYTTNELVGEQYFNYTIKLIIQKIIKRIGYSIISMTDMPKNTILITAQKPGALTTTKAHQVLGAIIAK